MFFVYTMYWVLDVYILGAKFRFLLSPESGGPSQLTNLSGQWQGGPSTGNISSEYFAVIYMQRATGMTLVRRVLS